MAAAVEVHELIDVVAGVEPTCRERSTLRSAVAAAARLRSWLDGRDVQLAAQLADVVSFPEQELAGAEGRNDPHSCWANRTPELVLRL